MLRGPGINSTYGDEMSYDSYAYRIIQPHFSKEDWTPDRTPSLWGRLPNENASKAQNAHQQVTDTGYPRKALA